MTFFRRIITFAFLSVSHIILAQSIITDRPDQTESSSTILKESLQIESGMLFGSVKDDFFSEEILLAPSVLWRYGITNKIELRLLTEFASVKDKLSNNTVSGVSDLQIGAKIQLLKKEDTNTEIAFLSHVIVPTAKDELSLNEFGVINKLAVSHTLSDIIGLGYNIGYDYFGSGNGNFTYSLALGFGISGKIGFYIESFGEIAEFKDHLSNFDTGLTYLLKENSQLDVSFGVGLNHKMNYVSLGYSLNISKQTRN